MSRIACIVAFSMMFLIGLPVGAAETVSLSPPVLLPDGREFKTWERPPQYKRTYYVDPSRPGAADSNPGDENRPFKTIARAAEVLEPGQRVLIAPGVYRERVRPARGGMGPDAMISYEAAPGAEVILSGAEVVSTPWNRIGQSGPAVWTTTLPSAWFAEENPFQQQNLADRQIDRCMDWAVPTKGKPPNTLRRGLLFQDGQRLMQVAARDEVAKKAGSYWVDGDGRTLVVRPLGDALPEKTRFEATTRGMIFAPAAFGLGYVRVKGITVERSGNCFPRPQQGAISTMRGHHWIIEGCTVRQCNAIGIDIGDQFDTDDPRAPIVGHIIRGNTVTDCGIGGIEGKQIADTLIEQNRIARCGWQRAQFIWETGGIKVHMTHGVLIRKNYICDTIDAPGIWMDWQNQNSRCTQNLIVGARTVNGAIFMEASQVPNLVDRNIIWGTQGNGIYQHDCDELTIAQNFVAHSSDSGVRMQVCQGRIVGGRVSTARRNQVLGNILIANGKPLTISDPENTVDYNVFDAAAPFDLDAWRGKHGWDKHSVRVPFEAAFDPRELVLTWKLGRPLEPYPTPAVVTTDYWDRPYVAAVAGSPDPKLSLPGPFADLAPGRAAFPYKPF